MVPVPVSSEKEYEPEGSLNVSVNSCWVVSTQSSFKAATVKVELLLRKKPSVTEVGPL